MDIEPALLAEANPEDADSLISSNDPDDLANEQTWPTEEEMNGGGDTEAPSLPDADKGTTPKTVRRIPKGMSAYQASWIIDEEDDEDENDEAKEDGSEAEMGGIAEEEEMQDMPIDDDGDMDTDSRREVTFQDLDNEEEEEQ